MPLIYDAAVVGGGPAGAAAAREMAGQGLKVALIEKAELPRYKVCAGGLVPRARQLIPFDISDIVERECPRVELHFHDNGPHFTVERPELVISMTMRDQLDFRLVEAAEKAGAEIMCGRKMIGLEEGPDRVNLKFKGESLAARFVVGADGVTSTVARKAGWPENLEANPALEAEVFVPPDQLERFAPAAWFDAGVIPFGYGWVFPKREHLSVGIGSAKRGRYNLHGALEAYIRRLGLKPLEPLACRGHMIPTKPRRGPLARGRVLLVGDAAGLAEPATGEGLTFALLSGQLAAQAIMENNLEAGRVPSSYQSLLAKEILPELRRGRIIARLVFFHAWARALLFHPRSSFLIQLIPGVFGCNGGYRGLLDKPVNYLKLMKIWIRGGGCLT